ncbi:SigE family RNA polymerase sigma factor [Angustibacter peucedani]
MTTIPDGRTDDVDAERWTANEALTQLYAAHWRSLVRLSYLLVREQALAEEVVQDAFVDVHRRWRRLADHDRALAYLRVAVVNGSRSALRRRVVRQRWTAAGGPTRVEPAPRAAATAPSAEDAVLLEAERTTVNAALVALPSRQREVLVLRYHAGLSEAEIAAALDISRGAVKSHAHRGIAALRAALAQADEEEGR